VIGRNEGLLDTEYNGRLLIDATVEYLYSG
jgi:hypothetical protein